MKSRRRIIYIKKKFQLEIMLKIMAVWLTGVLISGALLYFFSGQTLTTRYENSRLIIDRTGNVILRELLGASAINLLLVLLLGVITTLYISHRLGGPLYRFEKTLESLRDGDVSFQVFLRKKDELEDLVPLFNETIKIWNGRLARCKKLNGEIAQAVEQMRPDSGAGEPAWCELKQRIGQLDELLNEFRTSDETD